MNEIKEFLMALRKDLKAKEIMKEMQETKSLEKAAEKYAETAHKLGFTVSKESLAGFLEAEEKQMRKITADAENSVEEALNETELDTVAGGAGPEKANDICESTFLPHEWCWISDSCAYIINGYSLTVDHGDDLLGCTDSVLAPDPFDEKGFEDIDLKCIGAPYFNNVPHAECYIPGN